MSEHASSDGPPVPCDCPCHGDPKIRHVMACCARCPTCGQPFRAGLAAHQARCGGADAPEPR
ncbi:MAG: hypothetical protein R3B48_20610 [Kofleriaceae bacterium]